MKNIPPMAIKALSLLCILSLLLVIPASITKAQARRIPDIWDEDLLMIRNYISSKKSPPPPKGPSPVVPAKDSNGPLFPDPPAVDQLLLKE